MGSSYTPDLSRAIPSTFPEGALLEAKRGGKELCRGVISWHIGP